MEILLIYLFEKSYLMIQEGQSEGTACSQSFYYVTDYEKLTKATWLPRKNIFKLVWLR